MVDYEKLLIVLSYYIQIPAGYTYSTILVAGNNVTGTMRRFGEILRRMYSKTLEIRRTDFGINYLG
jgi:hypothetical protein